VGRLSPLSHFLLSVSILFVPLFSRPPPNVLPPAPPYLDPSMPLFPLCLFCPPCFFFFSFFFSSFFSASFRPPRPGPSLASVLWFFFCRRRIFPSPLSFGTALQPDARAFLEVRRIDEVWLSYWASIAPGLSSSFFSPVFSSLFCTGCLRVSVFLFFVLFCLNL